MLVNKYLSSTALFNVPGEQSGAAGGDPAAVDPAAAAADPNAGGDPAAVDPGAADPAADPNAGGDPAARPHGNTGRQPWYMNRINEETNRRVAESGAREAAERRAADAEAMLARMQSGQQPANGQPAAAQPQRGALPADEGQYQTHVMQAAQALNAAQTLTDVSTAMLNAGKTQFADFQESVNLLKALGPLSPEHADDFVFDLAAIDKANAHIIIDALAKDPEKAAQIVNMHPRARISELTRISMSLNGGGANGNGGGAAPANPVAAAAAAAPRKISNAPAPRPAVQPSAAPAVKTFGADEMSDEEFSAAWDKKYMGAGG